MRIGYLWSDTQGLGGGVTSHKKTQELKSTDKKQLLLSANPLRTFEFQTMCLYYQFQNLTKHILQTQRWLKTKKNPVMRSCVARAEWPP